MRYGIIFALLMMVGCTLPGYYTLRSKMDGVVLLNGEPVEGAVVTYETESEWYGARKPEVVYSDSLGRFSFEAWKKPSLVTLLHQPVIRQKVTITHEGKTYQAWSNTKMNYGNNGELGRPIRLECYLDGSEKRYETKYGRYIVGICDF